MKQSNYKGEWARSSATPSRKERIKAHEEFEASELKRMLDDGWKASGAKVKRPRIKQEKFKIVMVFNKPMKITIEEYNKHWLLAFGK